MIFRTVLVVDGHKKKKEAIAESLNQYFTSTASSLLDGRKMDRKNEGNHQPSRDQCAILGSLSNNDGDGYKNVT